MPLRIEKILWDPFVCADLKKVSHGRMQILCKRIQETEKKSAATKQKGTVSLLSSSSSPFFHCQVHSHDAAKIRTHLDVRNCPRSNVREEEIHESGNKNCDCFTCLRVFIWLAGSYFSLSLSLSLPIQNVAKCVLRRCVRVVIFPDERRRSRALFRSEKKTKNVLE